MNELHYIIITGGIISLLSISGLVLVKTHKSIALFVEKHLMELSALSAGIFLVTSSLLIKETFEVLPVGQALLALLIGGIGHSVLHKIVHHHTHGPKHEHEEEHRNKGAAWKVLIGDTIHNVADGLLLVSSFGFGSAIGFSSAVSIALHELPQEVSEFLVLRRSGYTNLEAGYRNVATALSIFVGIGLGLVLINTEIIQAYLLGATAMFFISVVFTDLFPVRRIFKKKQALRMVSFLLLGVLFMSLITKNVGHSHNNEEEHGADLELNHSYDDIDNHEE